jgi:hypothetical protein
MNRLALAVLLLVGSLALADELLKHAGTNVGPINAINCLADGGLACTRSSSAVGSIQCLGATATEPGCVTPSAQTFAGQKSFGNGAQVSCVAHGSLTACSGGNAGLEQCCSTHAALVFCNGTSNVELNGTSAPVTLASFHYDRLFFGLSGYAGNITLPYAYTVTAVNGAIAAGTGAGSINLRFTDGVNNCDCAVDCDSDQTSITCTGNCTYAASSLVLVTPNTDGCTTPPTIRGGLTVVGTKS